MNKIPFWLVWNPNGGAPTRKHDSENEAQNEAVRLAKANPGQAFYVLAPVSETVKNDIRIRKFQPEGHWSCGDDESGGPQ